MGPPDGQSLKLAPHVGDPRLEIWRAVAFCLRENSLELRYSPAGRLGREWLLRVAHHCFLSCCQLAAAGLAFNPFVDFRFGVADRPGKFSVGR